MKQMDQLNIGELMLAKDGTYAKVFSFGHLNHNSEAEFLQIKTAGLHVPLEITADHMVAIC